MTGIPTTYAGVNFRSRLEARWAAFFNLCDWPWEYEPAELEGWIPDFYIEGDRPFYVEVKSARGSELDQHKPRIDNSGVRDEVMLVGASPVHETSTIWDWAARIGMLRESVDRGWNPGETWWDYAVMTECPACATRSMASESGDYTSRPCGHYCGGHLNPFSSVMLRELWHEAGNATQWKPPRGRRAA